VIEVPPSLVAFVDQVSAMVRENKRDGAAAEAESRCALPEVGGCGKVIDLRTEFRDHASKAEYGITHLCQSCQDKIFMPPPEEMYEDLDNYGRCHTCGHWCEYVHIDVEVGVIKGFDCCPDSRPPHPGRCDKEHGCLLTKGHDYNCEHNPKAVY
jgi:hypothetical protein